MILLYVRHHSIPKSNITQLRVALELEADFGSLGGCVGFIHLGFGRVGVPA